VPSAVNTVNYIGRRLVNDKDGTIKSLKCGKGYALINKHGGHKTE
jgi:hypothetical protein